MNTKTTRVEFPEKAIPLFKPAPYKVMHGGRGGGKSWCMARALLLLGSNKPLFIVCGREIQRSIKESVHKLLADQIPLLGLENFYEVFNDQIIGKNGSKFVFVGVRNNVAAIKSMEAIDIFWLTEATFVSKNSWEVLLPTVRRDPPFGPFGLGSEIWLDFNPELLSDETYQRFVVDPPDGTVVVNVNWIDNPWFPDMLRKQKDELRRKDYDAYLTVWEGKTRKALQGAIYAKELGIAIEDGRVNPNIKYDRSKGVIVSFDLGKSDMCSLWFMQQIGMNHHAIDFYENCGYGIDHYLEEIQNRKYLIQGIWLPHDGAHETQAAPKSIERQCKDVYKTPGIVRVVPRVGHTTKINALRALFPRLSINESTCSQGILALQHYQYGVHPETGQRTTQPLHNWASHAASSISDYAVMLREGNKPKEEEIEQERSYEGALGWMG